MATELKINKKSKVDITVYIVGSDEKDASPTASFYWESDAFEFALARSNVHRGLAYVVADRQMNILAVYAAGAASWHDYKLVK